MVFKKIKSVTGYYAIKKLIKLKVYQFKARKFILKLPFVHNEISTLERIYEKNCSIARYGDGEIGVCLGIGIYFQEYDIKLSKRLRQILVNGDSDKLMVCIAPHINSCFAVTPRTKTFIYKFIADFKESYVNLLNADAKYGSTFISRPDSFTFTESELGLYKQLLRKIWASRDVLIVTGEGSRFDLIPELFDNIRSCEYIYGLPEHAFREYDKLLDKIKLHDKGKLILLSLGPTATVLAYDLAMDGFQAIDLGHLPSCFEIAKSDSRPVKTGY